ncbi:MAG: tetratricopeptide repeat protein [Acidobacteria bacterium]|nr:tetratricopeptide repeat protein [Acidobacteriota bacterium]
MGTTKLTRKEIVAEDAVHETIVSIVDFIGAHRKKILILGGIAIIAALGIYGGLLLLEKKEIQAQEILGRGIDFYHATIDPEATDDPYGKGSGAVFSSEPLKYQAAAGEFSSIVSGYGYTKVSAIALYYLGLTQLKQGNTQEGLRNLEKAAGGSRVRVIGDLARRVLAQHYAASGNYGKAKEILEGIIDDPDYELPKEDLSIQLSRILVAEGKREEAVKVLEKANSQGSESSSFRQKLTAELDSVLKITQTEPQP